MPITRLYTDAFSPSDALQLLKEGNFRFINNMRLHRDLLEEMTHTAAGQRPFAAVLSCMDSRTSGELVFDQGFGDIFSIRNAGNVVTDNVLGSLEFAAVVAGVKLILVMGHTNCGAIKGACDRVELGHLTGVLADILPAVELEKTETVERSSKNPTFVQKVALLNTLHSMQQIVSRSPLIADLAETGKLSIVGALYDVATGKVNFL
ncbi:MAG: carbonic anhydrase [Bacteroidetes bacterium]|nr:carbonic anhydrase [Bacteroidota bacterium]